MEQANSSQLVVFALGGEAYALPIAKVHEIIRYTAPRSVSSGDPNVCGVISLRGRIVPVYDLSGRLNVERAEAASVDNAKIVIVEHDEALAGIVVDDVEEVLTLDASSFDELPAVGDPLVDKVAKVEDRLIIVLRAQHVFGAADDAGAIAA
jgi:purine-binding chemotaxis protein CheW